MKRQLVGSSERLVVIEGCTHVLDARPNRVLPCVITVGVQRLVYGCIRLFYLCMGGTLETCVQMVGEIPPYGEVSIPQELLIECKRKLRSASTHHVSFLQFIVITYDFGVERKVLG